MSPARDPATQSASEVIPEAASSLQVREVNRMGSKAVAQANIGMKCEALSH
jgi:hypothetical protein